MFLFGLVCFFFVFCFEVVVIGYCFCVVILLLFIELVDGFSWFFSFFSRNW